MAKALFRLKRLQNIQIAKAELEKSLYIEELAQLDTLRLRAEGLLPAGDIKPYDRLLQLELMSAKAAMIQTDAALSAVEQARLKANLASQRAAYISLALSREKSATDREEQDLEMENFIDRTSFT